LDIVTNIAGAGLDSLGTPDKFPSVSSDNKEYSRKTGNPKTDIVVTIVGIVVVTIRRTAIIRIVVPRTAAQHYLNPPHAIVTEIA